MPKHYEWSSLCRIYWTEAPETELCIQGITEVVNSMYQNAVPYLVEPCVTVNGIGGIVSGSTFQVSPNPVQSGEPLWLTFSGGIVDGASVQWLDLTGRVVASERWVGGGNMSLSTAGLAPGAYLVQVLRPSVNGTVVKHSQRVTVR